MMKQRKKMVRLNGFNCLVGFVMLIVLSSFVSANFGVGSPAIEELYPGQSVESAFSLQNTLDGARDVVVMGSMLKGEDYVSFVDDVSSISLSAGKVVVVPVVISVPRNAKVGDIYEVEVLFETVSGGGAGGGGTVEFKMNVQKSFVIGVVQEPGTEQQTPAVTESEKESAGMSAWLWVLIIVVVVLVLWFIVRMMMKGKGAEEGVAVAPVPAVKGVKGSGKK